MSEEELLDRFRGMLTGHFLGDALGAPHEFRCNKDQKYTGKLEYQAFYYGRFGHYFELGVAQFTDDSEMTITLMRSIISEGRYDYEKVIQSYIDWANSGTWCLGKNTRNLFKGIKTLRGYYSRAEKMNPDNQSNGAMMRCSSLALFPDQYRNIVVAADCAITNNNSICIEVNILYITMLHQALKGRNIDEIIMSVKEMIIAPEILEVFDQATNKQERKISNNTKGWTLHAFYCTIYAALYFDTYTEAINYIIKLGGDTDTNAAIAGAFWGARLGYEQLLAEQKDNIQAVLSFPPHSGPNPRAPQYLVNDFEEFTQSYFNLVPRS